MKTYEVVVKYIGTETWQVKAINEADAKEEASMRHGKRLETGYEEDLPQDQWEVDEVED